MDEKRNSHKNAQKPLLCAFLWLFPLLLTVPRVAVLDFENLTRDRSLDWLSAGLAEKISTELYHSRNFRLIERRRLGDVLGEIKLNRSAYVDPTTALRMGKMLGADTLLIGAFQKSGDQLRITARLVDVETGASRAQVEVNGLYKNIFGLENDLASKLVGAALAPAPQMISMEAFHAFSSAVYYLHHDLIDDAIANFNRALKLSPDYPEAQFYKGVALEKRSRWDEAIALFKSALPSAPAEPRVIWSWQAPFEAGAPDHIVSVGIDFNDGGLQQQWSVPEPLIRRERRLIYAERNAGGLVLHIADPEHHVVRRLELPGEKVLPVAAAFATDRLTILRLQGSWYGIGADASIWWHKNMPAPPGEPSLLGVVPDAIFTFAPSERRLAVFDDRTFDLRWERRGLAIDRIELLKTRKTVANGTIAILKTEAGVRALRLADGTDAWTFTTPNANFSQVVTERFAIAFEWDRRMSVIDIETGKTVLELPVSPYADSINTGAFGGPMLVFAVVQGNTLYFLSKTQELYAVRLGDGSASVAWHVPVNRSLQSLREAGGHVYATSPTTGEFMVLDSATGAIQTVVTIERGLLLNEASTSIVSARSDTMLYGLDPNTGVKRWGNPAPFPLKDTLTVNGILIARPAATQISALEPETGAVLWQYSGTSTRPMSVTGRSVFIAEENGLKEYAVGPAPQAIGSVEILAELAGALAAKGNVEDASVFLEKARQLDPDYPPVRLLRSRLLHDGRELAAYAGLVGRDSQAGQKAEAELKRDYQLGWRTALDIAISGTPRLALVRGKLITAGWTIGRRDVMAVNPKTGDILWRQPAERFSGVTADASTGRVWHVTGDEQDQTAVILYSLSIANGERKELARFHRRIPVTSAAVSFVRGRLCVLTVSPDLVTKSQLIGVDCFTPDGARLSSDSHRVPEKTFLTNTPPLIREVDGHPLLWPAASVLVDGDAIYAFTPDGFAYKQMTIEH